MPCYGGMPDACTALHYLPPQINLHILSTPLSFPAFQLVFLPPAVVEPSPVGPRLLPPPSLTLLRVSGGALGGAVSARFLLRSAPNPAGRSCGYLLA